jgi:hypothetical protein
LRRLSLFIAALLVALPSAHGQARYDDEAWRELWLRINRGTEVESLLKRPPDPARLPAVQTRPTSESRGAVTAGPRPGKESAQEMVHDLACQLGLDPALALALIEQESGFRHSLRGRSGELGAAQILPATGGAFGFDFARLANDFLYNVRAGLSILKRLLEQTGDEREALRAYNGGRGWRALSEEARRSVQSYADRVLARRDGYGQMACSDRSPALPSSQTRFAADTAPGWRQQN